MKKSVYYNVKRAKSKKKKRLEYVVLKELLEHPETFITYVHRLAIAYEYTPKTLYNECNEISPKSFKYYEILSIYEDTCPSLTIRQFKVLAIIFEVPYKDLIEGVSLGTWERYRGINLRCFRNTY